MKMPIPSLFSNRMKQKLMNHTLKLVTASNNTHGYEKISTILKLRVFVIFVMRTYGRKENKPDLLFLCWGGSSMGQETKGITWANVYLSLFMVIGPLLSLVICKLKENGPKM